MVTSNSFQTYDRLQTNFVQTSDVRLLLQTLDLGQTSNIRFWILDFEFHTSDLGLLTDFELQTSEFELQTLNFRLRVRILDFGYTSDRPRPSDFELRSLNFRKYRLLQISLDLKSSDFGLQTSEFKNSEFENPRWVLIL